MRKAWKVLAGVGIGAVSLLHAPTARACGGCFAPPLESTVVTSHQMVVSISPERSVLWDQISYSGAPSEFAWVLPVKPGAVVELASDAFFEALDVGTQSVVVPPRLSCSFSDNYEGGGVGCMSTGSSAASSSGGPTGTYAPSVTVLHKGTVGPYATVTLRSTDGDALQTWLDANGYQLDDSVAPVVAQYVAEQFDFIALKLRPGEGVESMKPVRVVTPGSNFTFPLRMVAAGTGAKVGITLFVIGEGRWGVQNGTNAIVDDAELEWDFAQNSSNYTVKREAVLAGNGGNTWLTTHALPGTLLESRIDPRSMGLNPVTYATGKGSANTIAEAFALRAEANEETPDSSACVQEFRRIKESDGVVTDLCASGTCRAAAAGEEDSAALKCGAVDDLAAALIGMHPKNVWITRLEADLPRSALAQDLSLTASADQAHRDNFSLVDKAANVPANCTSMGSVAVAEGTQNSGRLAGLLSAFAPLAFGMTVLRRASRRKQG